MTRMLIDCYDVELETACKDALEIVDMWLEAGILGQYFTKKENDS